LLLDHKEDAALFISKLTLVYIMIAYLESH
jgi:hypothetical protein